MGAVPSTARIQLRYLVGGETAIRLAYDYVDYLENMSAKRQPTELAIPVVLEESYAGMCSGTHCYLVSCPHCNGSMIVARDTNFCGIYRHGTFKDKSGQLPPHATKDQVDLMLEANVIWGCGQPFEVDTGTMTVKACDWEKAQATVVKSNANANEECKSA